MEIESPPLGNYIHVTNLHARVTEEILWELFIQIGVVHSVSLSKTKDITQTAEAGVQFQVVSCVDYGMITMKIIYLIFN
jgi:RNA recognition motif-containing protein